jgi:hypothetical protein
MNEKSSEIVVYCHDAQEFHATLERSPARQSNIAFNRLSPQESAPGETPN